MNAIVTKIETRIYVKADIKTTTALSIASGNDDVADITVLRDYDSNPIIPGTTLAGALRDYARNAMNDDIVDLLFGSKPSSRGENVTSTQSRLIISDCYEKDINRTTYQIRDMVGLNPETKTPLTDKNAKFDMEVIEKDALFDLRMELLIYENDDSKKIISLFGNVLKAMEMEKILLGTKKSRGLGRFTIENVHIDRFDLIKDDKAIESTVKRWLEFSWENIKHTHTIDELITEEKELPEKIDEWIIPFVINNSLLIRSYLSFQDSDSEMFKSKGNFVIPGTSFTGALKNACYNILHYDLGINDPDVLLNQVFGFVDERSKKARQSSVIISDIELKENSSANYTRNKVNRFTGGIVDSALFTSKPIYEIEGDIKIQFREKIGWIYGLIHLALQDIGDGIMPVGGETSVGRGIFFIKQEDIPQMKKEWISQLKNKLMA